MGPISFFANLFYFLDAVFPVVLEVAKAGVYVAPLALTSFQKRKYFNALMTVVYLSTLWGNGYGE